MTGMTIPDLLAAALGEHVLVASDVATAIGVSPSRIHQLDDELQPVRRRNGTKRYSPRHVEAFLTKRAAGDAR